MKLIETCVKKPTKLRLGLPTRETERIQIRGAEAVTRAQAAANEKRMSDEAVQNSRKVADELAKDMLAVEAEKERLLAIATLAAREKVDLQNRLPELERQANEVARGGQQQVASVHQEAQALVTRQATCSCVQRRTKRVACKDTCKD